ncbi:MAG: MBL fold metallo-hydrolase [Planctomycetota bacterium]|nr:MBL fold metallo-hydrolase [Planctomycetota bacterium]
MKIRFHGAVRTVTGSLHIVETARGEIVLLDCGMFQGRRKEARERNEVVPLEPKRVKAVVLSHAHIDHIGNLPTWVARGMKCPIFATSATADLCGIMLRDSAYIQENDARHVNKHRRAHEKPVTPLYTMAHAEAVLGRLVEQPYRTWFEVVPGLRASYHDAGHLLGSASILLEEQANGSTKRLAFTGDVGRTERVILRDPEPFPAGADVVLSESTYGDREHPPKADLKERFAGVIERTVKRGGKVIVPAFALGRTQSLMYALYELQKAGRLPKIPVYVDSPLACRATEIVERHPECYDLDAARIHGDEGTLFAVEGYSCITDVADSKELNASKQPCIIISASGMCEAGRILHHLVHNAGDERNTILIVGFQAEHTLGRRFVEGWETVRIFGRKVERRAEVVVMNGFSAHADRVELAGYLDRCRPAGPLYLVHGDERQALAFETYLEKEHKFPDVRIPYQGDEWVV